MKPGVVGPGGLVIAWRHDRPDLDISIKIASRLLKGLRKSCTSPPTGTMQRARSDRTKTLVTTTV
jgi:hypothetical protein